MKLNFILFVLSIGTIASMSQAEIIDDGFGSSGSLRNYSNYSKIPDQKAPCVTTSPLGCSPSVGTMQNAFVAIVINNRFADAESELISSKMLVDGSYNEYYGKVLGLRDIVLAAKQQGASTAQLQALVSAVDLKNIRESVLRTNAIIWFVDQAAKNIKNFPHF